MSKLIEKIQEEAQSKVNSTLEEAGKRAAEIIKSAENDISIFKAQNMKDTTALREEILRRRQSVANLDVKKLLLAAKQEKLDEVYSSALRYLANMPKDKYLSIITAMLNNACDGDTIKIAKKDKDVITAGFIASYAGKKGMHLELAKDFADIMGGIIICGKSYDKNLSFEAELEAVRDDTESDIAKELFGEF